MKLIIIDGNAIMHRAYHAIPPLTDTNGEQTNAVYGLISMLLKIIEDLVPTHIAVCFDRPEPTFRKKEYASYQSKRPEMDMELSGQFEKAKDALTAINICFFEKAGFEADDIIGTLVKKGKTKKMDEIVVVTGDKDILQLVEDKDNIKVYMPVKGLSQAILMSETEVKEKLGIPPDKIIDYKALVGDQSDNYPGIKGIGPVTAVKLLREYGSFPGVYDNLDKIEGKTKQLLVQYRSDGEISYKLARIISNVSVDIDFDKLSHWDLLNPQIDETFDRLSFRSLKSRIKKMGEGLVREKQLNLL